MIDLIEHDTVVIVKQTKELNKRKVAHLIREFSHFMEPGFITVIIRALVAIRFNPTCSTMTHFDVSRLRRGLPAGLFLVRFPANMFTHLLSETFVLYVPPILLGSFIVSYH
jgi:hypothetical protein